MIAIVDYDVGNVASIANMIAKVGGRSVVTRDPGALREADKIVLPGVGAFDTAVTNLRQLGLFDLLNDLVLNQRKPTLGVCLGAQLVGLRSEEGSLPGFGWLDFELVRFRSAPGEKLRVPHMGWNTVFPASADIKIFDGVPTPSRFYFVHSYYMVPKSEEIVLSTTNYGNRFVSAVGKNNVIATQFHPEKSHKFGMALYRNFVKSFQSC